MTKNQKISCFSLTLALLVGVLNTPLLGKKQDSTTTKTNTSLSAKKRAKSKERRDKIPKKPKIEHAFKDMTFEELKQTKNELITTNKPAAVKFLERMIVMCDNLTERRAITLELADLLFETSDFEKAGTTYQEFAKLYPGSDKVEYASFKAIDCLFHQIFDADRDQTKTKETLDLATNFLTHPSFATYNQQVKDLATKCRERLLEHETNVIQFYMNRGSYLAANNRLENVRATFIDALPSSEPLALSLEIELATKLNDSALADTKRKELALKFPDASAALAPQKPIRLANRF